MRKILCLLCVTLLISCGGDSSSNSSSSGSDDSVLKNVEVSKSATQLIVKNNSTSSWTDVKIELNGSFTKNVASISAGGEARLGFLTFADSDGKRFDPFTYLPKDVQITCYVDGVFKATIVSFQ